MFAISCRAAVSFWTSMLSSSATRCCSRTTARFVCAPIPPAWSRAPCNAACARSKSRPLTSGLPPSAKTSSPSFASTDLNDGELVYANDGELVFALGIIRVDRLDPSKNQQIGFLAFERLLESRPDLCGRVRFLAFMVPSRTDLNVYREYRDAVYRTIEDVNARFAEACGGPPIRVFYTNDRDQALAAMQTCQVLLINSLQDGMNLVAKEWAVVADTTRPGVLVVSETAGVAAEALGTALLISPLDIEGTARAMAEALDMPSAERRARHAQFLARVVDWSARDWLNAQLADLHVTD